MLVHQCAIRCLTYDTYMYIHAFNHTINKTIYNYITEIINMKTNACTFCIKIINIKLLVNVHGSIYIYCCLADGRHSSLCIIMINANEF